ncbi:hypothetical protein scyTo_0022999, partial [Scyliorhinus torazame]|nr:hypothetical protein [Scyliorhinus torazame]
VVQFKQQSRLEEKRKKALDLQLDFIVGQTEKYSDLLSQSLNESLPASKPGSSQLGSSLAGSAASTPPVSGSATEDEDFEPHEEEDDEETIEVEEKQAGNDAETRRREIELLRRESELPLDEVLRSLPAGLAEEGASSGSSDSESSEERQTKSSKALQNAHRLTRSRDHREELEDEEFTADEGEGRSLSECKVPVLNGGRWLILCRWPP